jgi:hypothetical protein
MDPLSPNAKGAIACAAFDKRALEKGGIVSIPCVEARYDRVLDLDGKLFRVQVKYSDRESTHSAGSIHVDLASYGGGRVRHGSYDRSEVDAVVVYLPRADVLCWLGPDVFEDRSTVILRTAPTRNGQTAGVRFASDYEW